MTTRESTAVSHAMISDIKPSTEDFTNPANWISLKDFAAILGMRLSSTYVKISNGEDMPELYKFSSRITRLYRPQVEAWLLARQRLTAGAIQRRRRDATQAHAQA